MRGAGPISHVFTTYWRWAPYVRAYVRVRYCYWPELGGLKSTAAAACGFGRKFLI